MEFDRYSKHHYLFVLGIVCLFVGISCLAMAIFLMPFTFLEIDYNVPLIFFQISNAIQKYFSINELSAQSGIVYFIIFLGFFLLLIAEMISNYIDNQLYKLKKAGVTEEVKRARSESWRTTLLVLSVIFLAIIAIKLFEWTISTPSV